MDPLRYVFFPWANLELSGLFMFMAFMLFVICVAVYYILENSKILRYLLFKRNYTYLVAFSSSILFLFLLYWYIALPLIIIVIFFSYKAMEKDLAETREEELKGGWCCNKKCREYQIKTFKLKPSDEQGKELEYYINHPLKLSPVILAVIGILIPIAITICLWALGTGYKWH